MTDSHETFDVMTLLIDELGTEVELRDRSELPYLAGTPTITALEKGADLLRRNGREVPEVIGSVLQKVYPDRVSQ